MNVLSSGYDGNGNVALSTDGITYTTALTGSSLAMESFVLPQPPLAATHVRFIGRGHSGDPNQWNGVTELEIFGLSTSGLPRATPQRPQLPHIHR